VKIRRFVDIFKIRRFVDIFKIRRFVDIFKIRRFVEVLYRSYVKRRFVGEIEAFYNPSSDTNFVVARS
jgi:hypothetical protein